MSVADAVSFQVGDRPGDHETKLCESCGAPVGQPATGRPRRYCSAACRLFAHRYRRSGEWDTRRSWRVWSREQAERHREGAEACAAEGTHVWGRNINGMPYFCARCGINKAAVCAAEGAHVWKGSIRGVFCARCFVRPEGQC